MRGSGSGGSGGRAQGPGGGRPPWAGVGRPRGPSGGRGFVRPEEDPPGTSRLFIAVPLPDEVRAAVGGLMERVAGGAVDERGPGQPRWVRVDGLHLTLRFLGATPDPRRQEIARAIVAAAAGVEPFDVRLSGGGAFPNPYQPRVLWLAIASGAPQLADLAARVDRELQPLGWTPEDRPFRPHLTLARTDGVSGAREAAARLVEAARDVDAAWRADRIVLYRSLLGRGPARYESLAEAPLG